MERTNGRTKPDQALFDAIQVDATPSIESRLESTERPITGEAFRAALFRGAGFSGVVGFKLGQAPR